MGVHVVAMAKLKLLAGGLSNWQLLCSLLWLFVLKLPLTTLMPASFSDMGSCLRFLLFQLNHILFHDTPMVSDRRWRRALRLLRDRIIRNERSMDAIQYSDMETLNAIAMLAL